MSYEVRTQGFEGPFDLLLHLISKRELDIYAVSLGQITEEYLATIKEMQDLDLEVATEFLVVAATLIEIKAARLLPGPPVDDEHALALAERDLLIARLLQYKAFKDAAEILRTRVEENARYFARTAGPGERFERLAPDLLARVTPDSFAAIAVAALTPRVEPVLDLSHITPITVTVADAMDEILGVLRSTRSGTFRSLTRACGSRIDVVVRFLAVLELVKRGEVDVGQTENFGEIQVTLVGDGHLEDGTTVDEYDGEPVSGHAPEGGGA